MLDFILILFISLVFFVTHSFLPDFTNELLYGLTALIYLVRFIFHQIKPNSVYIACLLTIVLTAVAFVFHKTTLGDFWVGLAFILLIIATVVSIHEAR